MTPLSAFFKYAGGLAMGVMVPVLAGFIAESIADRPGLAVGFLGGILASSGNAALSGYVWAGDNLGGFQSFISKFGFVEVKFMVRRSWLRTLRKARKVVVEAIAETMAERTSKERKIIANEFDF